MSNNRRANAVLFGFDFQVNAAIVLMLSNIKELKTIRLEGNNEDIDLELNNGNHVLAQAKAVERSSPDFSHVRENLRKALITLSEGGRQVQADKLIYITNSPNPLNEDASRSIFWGPSRRGFSSLPDSSQKIITDYLSQIEQPLNTDHFIIQVVPFETDDEAERHKVVLQTINDFIGELHLDIPGLGKQLHSIWCNEIFKNGTKKDADIKLKKTGIIWPIIVITTDIVRTDRSFIDRFDSVQYDEIVRRYRGIIDTCCERIEFFTKILYDFSSYNNGKTSGERTLNFIDDHWKDYTSELQAEGIDSDILEGLTKIIVYNIIRRRYDIERIKQGVSL